jgi:DsrE/DsrF/DsrH-like protein
MAKYLLIESHDPFERRDVDGFYRLARDLARTNNTVTLLLVQNGVLLARAGADDGGLRELSAAGVEIVADEFSLKERGIAPGRLASPVRAVSLDLVIDQLAEGRKALWH